MDMIGGAKILRDCIQRRAWKDRFVDMAFDQFEATEWEKLVAAGMAKDDATSEMVRRRQEEVSDG